jgi:hypothetical protein
MSATTEISFLEAARHQGPVDGLTHGLYKYPARFSPVFARSAIKTFTSPGDIVLDPFVGGGTTVVESRLAGRHAFGSDISSLAVFLTKVKATALASGELASVMAWSEEVINDLNLHRPVNNDLRGEKYKGYDRNMPWWLRKICEQYLERLHELPTSRQRRFARCVLLACGQWAMDCKDRIPGASEFKNVLSSRMDDSTIAMLDFASAFAKARRAHGVRTKFRCVHTAAGKLEDTTFGEPLHGKVKLVLTSPPYPGVHVLYHRWNVRTRRETPAPFWIADCLDGHGSVYYTLGDRHQEKLSNYFAGVTTSFNAVRPFLASDGLVVQVVAFSQPEWQLPEYVKSMKAAGFSEAKPRDLGIACKGRLWRQVPGRRWYSQIRGKIASSKEVVLFHQPN